MGYSPFSWETSTLLMNRAMEPFITTELFYHHRYAKYSYLIVSAHYNYNKVTEKATDKTLSNYDATGIYKEAGFSTGLGLSYGISEQAKLRVGVSVSLWAAYFSYVVTVTNVGNGAPAVFSKNPTLFGVSFSPGIEYRVLPNLSVACNFDVRMGIGQGSNTIQTHGVLTPARFEIIYWID